MCAGLLAAACFAAFSNGYDHAFNLDSPDGLVNNPAVRDLRNIPSFFRDPTTLTAYRANAEYRPVLQVTYALNYAVSGYEMWSWHLVQILLHVLTVLGVYSLGRRLFRSARGGMPSQSDELVAFAAALLFGIHPTSSGVVNYLWARSSLLVAALTLPSVLLYMRAQDRDNGRPPWLAVALYTLALFAKVEAIAALGVYALSEVLRVARSRPPGRKPAFLGDLAQAADTRTLQRLWPFLLVSLVYAIIRVRVVPDYVVAARELPGASGIGYLATQVTAWWHYVGRYVAPIDLVADDMVYPQFTSFAEPAVLLALGGWVFIGVIARAAYGRYPEVLFALLAGLALISPTSSFMPLTEMVNEHRPYLPIAVASLSLAIPFADYLGKLTRSERFLRFAMWGAAGALLVSMGMLTWRRNEIFRTSDAYWADVLEKAPSGRAHVNFGLEKMRVGSITEARHHFEAALALNPTWHIVHLNLALLNEEEGRLDEARAYFDRAVRFDQYTGDSRRYRGQYLIRRGDYGAAREDLLAALDLAVVRFPVLRSLAAASAGLADAGAALDYTRACYSLDPEATENSIVEISTPFWSSPAANAAGIEYFRALDAELLPDRWWIQENIAILARRLGLTEVAEEASRRADELRGDD